MTAAMVQEVQSEIEAIVRDVSSGATSTSEMTWILREETTVESERRGVVNPNAGQHWVVEFKAGISGGQSAIDSDMPAPVRDFFIADVAQDVINDETLQSRPLCPCHNHQLILKIEEAPRSQLVWLCPSDSSLFCPVGEFWEWQSSLDR